MIKKLHFIRNRTIRKLYLSEIIILNYEQKFQPILPRRNQEFISSYFAILIFHKERYPWQNDMKTYKVLYCYERAWLPFHVVSNHDD